MYDNIRYETDDGIATVTLDRPEVYNALRGNMTQEINNALRRARNDDGVYIIVLTGAGDGFCAGADFSGLGDESDQTPEEHAAGLWTVQNVIRQLRGTPKPTIAAINGPAIGAGCTFTLGCDLRTMDPDAILREGFVRVGLVPGDGDAWLLPRLIGESKAREYLLTGRDIGAEEAEDVGLVVEISDNALEAAYDLAEELLSLPVMAVRNTNRIIDPQWSFEEYCEAAIRFHRECGQHPEQAEAVAAFQEDREPEYDRNYS